MAVLGRLGPARHVAVGAAVLATAAAGLLGIGESHDERFDAKQLTIFPVGENSLRVREVVDQDFGSNSRHGYERLIYDDFGPVTDVEASSPDAPADLDVTPVGGGQTRVRIGSPSETVRGQHRYELAYTYPEARLTTGQLELDLVEAGGDQETGRLEIVITGLELADVRCDTGANRAEGGCTLAADGDVYRGVIEPLAEGAGVTISATILGRTEPVAVPVPELPDRRSPNDRVVRAGAMGAASAAAAGGVFWWSRRRGRNEIYAGGAADAAYGRGPTERSGAAAIGAPGTPLPPPEMPAVAPVAAGATTTATRLVTDAELGELATIEFVPPKGITPWQGAALLKEGVDTETVGAWFSGLAASDVLSIEKDGDDPVLRPGPRIDQASPADRPLLQALFRSGREIELGAYDRDFAQVWSGVRSMQSQGIAESGWWSRRAAAGSNIGVAVLVMASIFLAVASSTAVAAVGFMIGGTVPAVILAALVGLVVAAIAYHKLRASRTAAGSALALRTESFRRFLAASEGQHVEWAWKQGLLREYSAWAVALGAADAWERALAASSVPPAEALSGPLLVYSMGNSFGRSYTAPSSSGGGGGGFGGGGFGGGGVGGGGGGGSSGSW